MTENSVNGGEMVKGVMKCRTKNVLDICTEVSLQ